MNPTCKLKNDNNEARYIDIRYLKLQIYLQMRIMRESQIISYFDISSILTVDVREKIYL